MIYKLVTVRLSFCLIKTINSVKASGKFSIIPTPIGNINDLTPNIIKSLYQADLIACEDRRVAGQLYSLIKNKKIIEQIQQQFGSIGLTSLVAIDEDDGNDHESVQFDKHMFYNYSNMGDKKRRKFLAKLSLQEQKRFKIQYLKYRSQKILNKTEQFGFKRSNDKIDELYGIEVSDYKHIETQINNTRMKKNRGVLIPLNTYSETKMFDLVRHLLETKHVALVSDAGMPCISDPGWRMIDMIKRSLPTVPIQVIGGPSSVDIMLNLAKITAKGKTLTGRFEGFASPEVSNITEQSIKLDKNLQLAKDKDFSIHFINSRKLAKQIYSMQKIYGENKKIIVTNQLTKKFQRKFNGTLEQLRNTITAEKQRFQAKGQMSYLLYSEPHKDQAKNPEQKQQKNQQKLKDITVTVDIDKTIKALKEQTDLKSKQISKMVTGIFGLKPNLVRKLVYDLISK